VCDAVQRASRHFAPCNKLDSSFKVLVKESHLRFGDFFCETSPKLKSFQRKKFRVVVLRQCVCVCEREREREAKEREHEISKDRMKKEGNR
jgi:hypothetical protein